MGKSMPGQAIRVGGVAERLADEIEELTKKETRSLDSRTSSARRAADQLRPVAGSEIWRRSGTSSRGGKMGPHDRAPVTAYRDGPTG